MANLKPKKIYLAIPYSGIEDESHAIANSIQAKLMKEGYLVFSPISMCHLTSKHHGLPGNIEFWKELDTSFIEWCEAIMVVQIQVATSHEGSEQRALRLIKESKGVQYEIELAKKLRKQILTYIYE